MSSCQHRHDRAGFTVIELLIVMAIVTIVGSLTAGAVFRVLASQDKVNTETTLQKLASELDVHWKAVLSSAKSDFDGLPANIKQNLLTLADNTSNSPSTPKPSPRRDDRARIIYMKLRLKQAFPTSFVTAINPTNPAPADPMQLFLPAQNVGGVGSCTGLANYAKAAASANLSLDKQSSALLVLALETSHSGVAAKPIDQLVGSSYVRSEGGLRYLVDGWGRPLQFYVFPALAGSPKAGAITITDLIGKDAQDPEELLNRQIGKWLPNMGAAPVPYQMAFNPQGMLLHPLGNSVASNFQTPVINRTKLVPIIASAGPDGDIGDTTWQNPKIKGYAAVNPFMDLGGPGAYDNLYSFRLRTTGARGD